MGLDVTGRYRYPAPDAAWLEQNIEDVLAPDLPIIDSHHHLWVEDGNRYLLKDLLGDTSSGHRILATVFVQAHYGYRADGPAHLACVGETEKVMEMRSAAPAAPGAPDVAAAIVAHADLTLGAAVDDVLTAHSAIAGERLRGIRHSVSRDEHFPGGIVLRPAPAGLLADTRYREGLERLVKHGLCFDAMLYHRQIPELVAMARAIPDLPIILDHLGCILGVGPYEGNEHETYLAWKADMALLADCPNVSIKIGGMGMIVCGARWHLRPTPPGSWELAEAWRPYVESCIELFGSDRCMFESNFPIDKAMYSYRTLWNAFKRLAGDASPSEKNDLFWRTAARVYGIAGEVKVAVHG